MKVKFADLRLQGLVYSEVMAELSTVLTSGRFIGGPWLDEFAERWARFCGTKYCVPTASGSSALTAAIMTLVPEDGTVLLPALSFAATAFSVVEAGCRPVYVDVCPNGLMNLDLAREACQNLKPDCIIPVHLYGQLVELEVDMFDTIVIEDACQAHGAFRGLKGDAACFSFYPSKNLGAAGDAGAVVTNSKATANGIATYINYGDPPGSKYAHTSIGTNARMDAMQAAILCVKLDRFWKSQVRRKTIAEAYTNAGIQGIVSQRPSSWHVYPVLVSDRSKFLEGMSKADIECGVHYPYTLPSIVADGAVYGGLDEAEFIAKHVVALPIGPHMDSQQATYVADTFHNLVTEDVVDDKVVWRVKDAN